MNFLRTHRATSSSATTQAGFTLIELLVVISIGLVLFGLISINLGQTQTTGSVATVVDTMLSDIKQQQLQAMVGDVGGTSSQQSQGLFIQSNNYTLFAGTSYSGADSNNFIVTMPSTITLATSFSGNTVSFAKGTGQLQSFVNGSNTITVNGKGASKVITIGRLGNVTVN